VSRVSLIPTVIQRIEMLDWLRKKIGCVSTHEEVIHLGITENNVNRFKVWADPSLTTMVSEHILLILPYLVLTGHVYNQEKLFSLSV